MSQDPFVNMDATAQAELVRTKEVAAQLESARPWASKRPPVSA
jgi:hypothetical protein